MHQALVVVPAGFGGWLTVDAAAGATRPGQPECLVSDFDVAVAVALVVADLAVRADVRGELVEQRTAVIALDEKKCGFVSAIVEANLKGPASSHARSSELIIRFSCPRCRSAGLRSRSRATERLSEGERTLILAILATRVEFADAGPAVLA